MKLFRRLSFFFAFVFSIFSAGSAYAHPHVWVTMEAEVEMGDSKEILGLRHKWTFDEGYTNFAIDGLDANGDGIHNEEELTPLAKTNVEALKQFEYFTFPFIGDEKVALKDPVDDRMEYKDKLLTLYFTVPLLTPVPYEKIEDFGLAVYDPEMYVALTFNDKAPVKIVSAKPVGCTAHVGESAAEAKDSIPSQPGESSDPSGSPVKSAREERRRLARAAQARSLRLLQYADRITIECKS
jgi:ABC-type uncharacterized transport system substrate-binding protein